MYPLFRGLTVIEVGNGSRDDHESGNYKRNQVRRQLAYLEKYGIDEEDLSGGLIVIRGEGYYRSDLDFFLRLHAYDEGRLRRVLTEWLAERPNPWKDMQFIDDVLEFSERTGESLSTQLSPASVREEERIASEWAGIGLKSSYPSLLNKKMKGPILERYVQSMLLDGMEEERLSYPIYANVELPRPQGVHESSKSAFGREADIIIVAPLPDAYRIIARVSNRAGTTISTSPQWDAQGKLEPV